MTDFGKKLKESEIKYGEIKLPKHIAEIFPGFNPDGRRNRLTIVVGRDRYQVLYDNDNTRIRTMRNIFVKHGIKGGDTVRFEIIEMGSSYRLEFLKGSD